VNRLRTPDIASIALPTLSVLLALGVGAVLIFAIGINPIVAYTSLFEGSFGSVYGITETIVKSIPLTLTGLAAAVSFKTRFFNIGGEGQFYLGALLATWVALVAGELPPILLLPAVIVAGLVGGILWIVPSVLLKIKFELNEIFTTLMMNFVMIYFVSFMVSGPMREPGGILPKTAIISSSAWLPRLVAGSRLHAGFLLALFSTFIVWWVLEKTTLGYRIKAVGASSKAARYAGMDVSRTIVIACVIGGAFAGLAGVLEVSGLHHRLAEEISPFPIGYGYLGIWVALLGRLNPLGVLVSSYLFAFLIVGGQSMQLRAGVPVGMIYVIQGLIVLFVISGEFLTRRRR